VCVEATCKLEPISLYLSYYARFELSMKYAYQYSFELNLQHNFHPFKVLKGEHERDQKKAQNVSSSLYMIYADVNLDQGRAKKLITKKTIVLVETCLRDRFIKNLKEVDADSTLSQLFVTLRNWPSCTDTTPV
jgi:hypothetical protein